MLNTATFVKKDYVLYVKERGKTSLNRSTDIQILNNQNTFPKTEKVVFKIMGGDMRFTDLSHLTENQCFIFLFQNAVTLGHADNKSSEKSKSDKRI
jgi:hypothetical protein